MSLESFFKNDDDTAAGFNPRQKRKLYLKEITKSTKTKVYSKKNYINIMYAIIKLYMLHFIVLC